MTMSRLVLLLWVALVSGLPTDHNDRIAFQRRIGPFSGDNRLPLGSFHQAPLNYQNGQLEEGILEPPKQEVAKRKLLLPIISEGYASTNFQGGASSKDKDTSIQEQSKIVQDAETKAVVTTKRPTKTTTTTKQPSRPPRTTSKRVIFRDETTPAPTKVPIINGYLFDELDAPKIRTPPAYLPSRPQTTSTPTTTESPYGRPLPLRGHFANPSQGRPTSFIQPAFNIPDQPSLAFDTQSTVVGQKFTNKADPQVLEAGLPAFVETDNGQRIDLYQGELITADNNPEGELVHFSFSPPQQSAGTKDKPVTLKSKPSAYEIPSSRPSETTPRPYRPQSQSPPQQDIYQAGYEQINVPDHTNHPRPGGPEKFDPNTFHEDRPALISTQQNSQSPSNSDYYPLGKPVHLQAPVPPRGPPGQSAQNGPPRPKPTSSSGSFFDFLIPSFIRSKSDRPNRRPPPPPPPQKRQPPPKNRQPRPPPQNRRHNFPIPSVPHIDPPRLDLNAPYGSPQNPILLHLPESFGQYPPPPQLQRRTSSHARFEDHHNAPPEPNELDENVIVNRLGEEFLAEIPEVQDLESQDQNNVIMGTVEEVDLDSDLAIRRPIDHIQVPGISQAVPTRQQAPFLPSQHMSHPLQTEKAEGPHIKVPKQPMALPYKLAEYRHKLQDPEFFRNVTQAHVFHYRDPDHVDQSNVSGDEPVSYIEESNPFFLRQVDGDNHDIVEEPQASQHQPLDLIEFAPPAKPKHYQTRTSKPDVNTVYTPNGITTSRPLASSMEPSFSVEAGHSPGGHIDQPSRDTRHPIAQQISSFLEFYLNNPKVSNKAPIISTSVDKLIHNHFEVENEIHEHPEESFEVGLDEDAAFPLLDRQAEEQLEEVFIASDSPQDSDWYILDTKGRRVMKDKSRTEEPKSTSEDPSYLESEPNTSPTTLQPSATDPPSTSVSISERPVEGGFVPVSVQTEN
ncbi:hypothetical protein TCAL_12371 [Tigriopus californicus]|uniref:Uncharacterized protein n=1 Tax=Tigriopus californicus TaxID=6832 RepID=A0A553PRC1_TIGCA|nr:uncharacterized protein LOC131891595 isoform X2 [Tigriopus californicus]TRY80238.1 hypothetical protein TCAL_12371 [Tigriopus californicus]|eukprot:TCALIF_12371-PA protein Name:"Protein of unknown function" AED:0.33 eAED:0.33 QI:359/1/0.75/1/0.66/0.75/4/0/954